ncbi:MAG: hypothetical protein EPO24_06950, partial [Bacteroidetes bacterium]
MKTIALTFIIILTVVLTTAAFSQEKLPDITQPELQAHVKYLSSEELQGRKSGEPGNEQAAKYIEQEFKSYGLQPKGSNGYMQEFDFISAAEIGEMNSLSMKVMSSQLDFKLNEDFRPLGFTIDTSVSASLVFV